MMAGGPISWMSKLQSIVATSSMEAEYVSAYPIVQEVTLIRAVLHCLELTRDKPTTLLIDNKSAIDLAHNPVYHQRSKHIDIKYHWLQDKTRQDKTRQDKTRQDKTRQDSSCFDY
jgi:hypothetical protein